MVRMVGVLLEAGLVDEIRDDREVRVTVLQAEVAAKPVRLDAGDPGRQRVQLLLDLETSAAVVSGFQRNRATCRTTGRAYPTALRASGSRAAVRAASCPGR